MSTFVLHTQLSHVTSNSKGRREFTHYASHTNKERELHKMAKIAVHAQQSLVSVYDRLKRCENRLHDGYDPHQSGCFQKVTSKVNPQLWMHVQLVHVCMGHQHTSFQILLDCTEISLYISVQLRRN